MPLQHRRRVGGGGCSQGVADLQARSVRPVVDRTYLTCASYYMDAIMLLLSCNETWLISPLKETHPPKRIVDRFMILHTVEKISETLPSKSIKTSHKLL